MFYYTNSTKDRLNKKYQKLNGKAKVVLEDGFTFYEQKNGVFTDTKNGVDYDISFMSFNEILDSPFTPKIDKIEKY